MQRLTFSILFGNEFITHWQPLPEPPKEMIQLTELKQITDFESLKSGDSLACEFHRDIHDYPKEYRFKVFAIVGVKKDTKEVILQKKNNIYFNYEMFVNGESILKSCALITPKQ